MTNDRPGRGLTALVTGSSCGIGVDLADCFARDGPDVILTARSEAALQEARSFAAPCGDFSRIGRYRTLRAEVEARRRAAGRPRSGPSR